MSFLPLAVLTLAVSLSTMGLGGVGVAMADDGGIEGVWVPATAVMGGRPFPDEVRKSIKLEVKGNDYVVTVGVEPDRGTVKLDPKASPKTLDITGAEGPNKGKTILAIYERKGDTLRVCYDLGGKGRPTAFESTPGSALFLVEYRRQAP